MAAINTLIKEINNRLFNDEFDKAIDIYTEIIEDKHDQWKINIVKEITRVSKEAGFEFMFTQNIADLLISDTKNRQVLLVWISAKSSNHEKETKLFEWIESTRQAFEDEINEEFGYVVNVLHVVCSEDRSDLDEFVYENDRFYKTLYSDINLERYSPVMEAVGTPKNDSYQDMMQFCFDMAYGLADMVFSNANETSDEKSNKKELKESSFNVIDIAPESFLDFLLNTSTAKDSMGMDEMFNLSLHSVFVNDYQSKNKSLIKCIHHSLTRKEESSSYVNIIYYDILSISNLSDLKSFLRDQHSNIVVIENLEASINAYLNFKKPDIIRILCQELDTNKENVFVLTATNRGWQHLVGEFPQLRVFFQNVFIFEKPTTDNLLSHFKGELGVFSLTLSPEAEKLVIDFFNYTRQSQNPQLFDFPMSNMLAKEVRYYHTVRKSKENPKNFTLIERQDIENAIKDEYVLDVVYNLSDILSKLDKLIGLDNVKKQIRDIAALVKINKLRKKSGTESATPMSLNSLFTGNPGTGKTTVARYLGEVYKSIGALQNGHVLAVSRQDIVKRFIGHTEENFMSIINKARGGILFIDEAYSLYNKDTDNDFGRDAINVLVDRLDDIREHTCVILGGYPEPMKKFLNSNPGLASRFPTTIEFKDYSADELSQIFMSFVHSDNFYMNEEAEKRMSLYIGKLVENKDDHFGNGRTCRNIFEKLKLVQARRITYADMDNSTDLNLLTTEDVDVLLKEMNNPQETKKRKLGYRVGNGS